MSPETPTSEGTLRTWWKLAQELLERGERTNDAAAVESGLELLHRVLAEAAVPDDGPDPTFALFFYNLGAGHFLRSGLVPEGVDEDLRLAEEALRRSLTFLPASGPGFGEVSARLGVVLAKRAQRDTVESDSGGALDEAAFRELSGRVTDAVETLESGWREMPAEDPYRNIVRYWRVTTRASRFLSFGGDVDDCETALTEFETILASSESGDVVDDAVVDLCHLHIALLRLHRSLPAEIRTSGRTPSLQAFAQVLAAGSGIEPDTVRTAIDHLQRIAGPEREALLDPGVMSSLRTMAMLHVRGTEVTEEDLAAAAADIDAAVGAAAQPDAELRSMQTLVRALMELQRGDPDVGATATALDEMIEDLGADHPGHQVLRGMAAQFRDLTAARVAGGAAASREEREIALELLENVLRELPDEDPERAATLTRLGMTLMRGFQDGYSRERERVGRVRALLLDAVGRPAADAENEALNNFLLVLMDGFRSLDGGDDSRGLLDEAIDRLKRNMTRFPEGHLIRTMTPGLLASLLAQRHARTGALEDLDAADYYAREVLRSAEAGAPSDERMDVMIQWFRAALPAARAQHTIDADRLGDAADAMRTLTARLSEDDALRPRLESDVNTLDMLQGILQAGSDVRGWMSGSPEMARMAESMEAAARALPQDSPYYSAEMAVAGNARIGRGGAARDVREIDAGLAMMGDAHDAADPTWVLRGWLLGMMGLGLLLRHEISRDPADLNAAIARLEEARRVGETDPLGSTMAATLSNLAGAYRTRGDENLCDRHRAGETGLASLRVRAWGVMLQSSTERAFDAAVTAAGEAAEVALLCTACDLDGSAVEALEWGRAMVLHTATTDMGLPALLRAGGHDDLAAEWEAASAETASAPWDEPDGPLPAGLAAVQAGLPAAEVPSDLRERVMAAIEGTEAERRLFSPAAPAEIGAALRDAGAAALAYLVPHEGGRGGLALVVGADGATRRVTLPRLRTGPGSRTEAFLQAQAERERADPDERAGRRADRRWAHPLGDLCDFAWTAVMEPLLNAVAETGAGAPGRPPRVVLVPVGELGAVPWHAARRTTGAGGPRYACQDAVITYAASARQFIDARRHGHRPWASDPLLVRVGGGGLHRATQEIERLKERHYSGGELLGARRRTRSSGPAGSRPRPARAEHVLDRLPGPDSPGASLLHLGCHAWSAPRPVDSYLELAGGEALPIADILRRARARPPGVPGGLVVLAACGSDLTGRHHDEALTLATAFLSAGAVGVVGARWSVHDTATLLFMSMFHHYLNAGYDDPAVALRAAQLWMLNPRRTVPPDLPADLDDAALAAPEAWAAFTYQGR